MQPYKPAEPRKNHGKHLVSTASCRQPPSSPLIESRISNSAAGVRGLIIHLKGTGCLLSQSDFRSLLLAYLIEHIYVNNPAVNSGLSFRIFPCSSTCGLMSYTARRQDIIKYNESLLKCLPGHILGKELMSVYVGEYFLFTDRRPYPNAAQFGSLTSGLSLPSFRYRSGWNSSGLLKAFRSCNIDLNKRFRTENRIEWSY